MLVAAALSIATLGASPMAFAQVPHTESRELAVNLPAGPLGKALVAVANMFGINVISSDTDVMGKTAPAVAGMMTAEDALKRILEKSDLVANRSPGGAFVIARRTTAADRSAGGNRQDIGAEPQALESFVVTGLREAVTATKFDVPPFDLPSTIESIGKEDLETLGVTRIEEIASIATGVRPSLPRVGLVSTGFFIRGFQGAPLLVDTFSNGFSGGFQEGITDTALLERVEILRGPTAVLYGQGQPGGALNATLKRPQPELGGYASFIGDSSGARRAEFDLTGPLIEDRANFRFIVVGEDSDSFRDFVETDRLLVSPQIDVAVTDRLQFSAFYLMDELSGTIDRGYGFSGDILQFDIPIERNLAEPWVKQSPFETTFLRLDLSYALTDNVDLSLFYVDQTQKRNDHEEVGVLFTGSPGSTTLSRYYTGTGDSENGQETIAVRLEGMLEQNAFIRHNVFAEVQRFEPTVFDEIFEGSVGSIDILNPVYSNGPDTNLESAGIFKSNLENTSYAIQDLIEFGDRFRLLLGLRYDEVSFSSVFRSPLVTGGFVDAETDQDDSKLTYRIGGVYRPSDNSSLFVNYGTGFLQAIGIDKFGNALPPEQSESIEFGTKLELFDQRASITGTLFQIEKTDIRTSDPTDPNFSISGGEARSRGFELDLEFLPTHTTRIVAGLAYIDAESTKSNDIPKGDRLPGSPEWSGFISVEQDLFVGDLPVRVNGVASYVGETTWRLPNVLPGSFPDEPSELPSFVQVDLGAAADFGPTTVQLNVKNVLDEEIVLGNGFGLVAPQAPRTFQLSVRHNF